MIARAIALVLVLVLAACAPTLQPPGDQPGPPHLATDHAVMSDGRTLPYRYWPAKPGREVAVAIALHGFNDYSNAFAEAGPWWADQGISVYAYDQRGFGATDYRGLWPGVPVLTRDLKEWIALARAAHPGKPVYLIGESMGGAVIVASVTAPDAPKVDGLVLAAPAVWGRTTMNPIYRFALWVVPRVMPGGRLSGRGLGIQASDNVPMLIALGKDPLIIKETRADSVEGLADLMDAALDGASKLAAPTLLLYGQKDQVIPRGAIDKATAAVGPQTRIVIYPDGWHMLFRDLQRKTVWQDTADWIVAPEKPIASGFERKTSAQPPPS